MTASVYVMDNGRYRKVGFSANPAQRAKQVGQGLPVAVVHTVETEFPRAVERAAHDLLTPHRVSREWFDVSVEDAIAAVNKAAKNHGPENVVFRPMRFTEAQWAIVLEAQMKHGGTVSETIGAMLRAYVDRPEPTTDNIIDWVRSRT